MEYDGTRHNIGFAVVDALASELGISFKRGLGDFSIAKSTAKEIVLIKPTTYMNRSGSAVRVAMKQHSIELEHLVVISDDFHINAKLIISDIITFCCRYHYHADCFGLLLAVLTFFALL